MMPADITTAFLDRDGVINRKAPEGDYVTSWRDFEFLPGAIDAIRRLNAARIRVVVVTNQRGIALGRMTSSDLAALHARMEGALLAAGACVDAILACPHDVGVCECRKPGVGLFLQAIEQEPAIDLERSIVVGDSRADVEAGARLGCRTYLVGSPADAAALRADGLPISGTGESLLSIVLDLAPVPTRTA